MSDAEIALREEIERVRERTRQQGIQSGLPESEAGRRADAAVEEFCRKWGIRPEIVGVSPASEGGPASSGAGAGSADPGGSPARTPSGEKAGPRTIGDLLERAREAAAKAAAKPVPGKPVPDRSGPATASTTSAPLADLVRRIRTESLGSAPPPASPSPPKGRTGSPTPSQSLSDTGVHPLRVRKPPAHREVEPESEAEAPAPPPPPAGGEARAADESRRRKLLDEFDRTYAQVQSMLEQRIGRMDGSAGAGRGGGGLSPDEVVRLAADLDRLMTDLRHMMDLCQGLVNQLGGALASPPRESRSGRGEGEEA